MAHQKRRMTISGDLEHRAHKSQNISLASYERYTVAWICALPKEMTAAQAVLDDVHEPLPRQKNDTNLYTLGSIGCHNIAIACLPSCEYGMNNAVNVLTNLTRTFTSIYLSLMVGIGGGVPRENFDIRLGDIVVGTRVVQHDLGKIIESGQIQHTAVPRTLAHLLGKALSHLQAEHQPHSSRIPLILAEMFRGHPKYAHPTAPDRLFSSAYPHSSQAQSCDECSPSALVHRSERSTNNPYIFYGTIASGNQVMKNSTVRDTVAQAIDAICFEMEAAGLNDICPCLTIRGICDYSDSHKSKEWQEYAAATAAAFAREFIEKLPPTEDVLASTPDSVQQQDYWLQNEKYNKCLRDLRETDPRDDKTRIEETKGGLLKDAYRWILNNAEFQEWHSASEGQLFWIKGDPGKGKTMLLCGLINELEKEHGSCLSYFFCQATEARLSNATAVLRGLIYRLVVQRPPLISYIEEKYEHAGKQLFEDGNAWQALSKIFMAMLEDSVLEGVLLIVDALDECITGQERLLDLIVRSSNVKWIVTSRNWPEIEQVLNLSTQKVRLHLELNQDSVCKAVEAFIEHKVEELAEKKRYDAKLKSDVKSYLIENADGTFLWVALVCQELADNKVFRKSHTRLRLELFPRGLDPLYGRMMEYISSSHDAEICREILALASVVYRPITLAELKTLLGSQHVDEYDELPQIIGCCGSFLTLRGDAIYFLHQSAKDFLLKKASGQILPSGLAYQHGLIFERSLQALSETLRRDVCKIDHPGLNIDKILPDVFEPLDPIRYSCVHWVDHLHECEPTKLNNNLRNGGDVYIFIQKKYLYWLESLSLLGSTVEGVKAMNKLEYLATILKAPEPVTKLLQDARRFILTHRRPIEIAPSQAYASGLVFSPECSLIRELFKDEEPDWINLKPKMDKDWDNCLQTLEGHNRAVMSVAVSPNNQLIASGGDDKMVKIWDITTGLCQHTLEDHDDPIHSITFLPDGRSLASASNTIKIWDTKTGLCLRTLEGHDKAVRSVASSPDGQCLASGSLDQTIKIWSSKTGKCLKTLDSHSGVVLSVAFSPNNQRLVSGSSDNTIKIWDMKSFSCLQTLQAHDDVVLSVALSPDSKRLASVSKDDTIKIWDAATGSSLPILECPSRHGIAIAFSADGKRLALSECDHVIILLDAESGTVLQTLEGFGGPVWSVVFTADSQHLVSGSEDGLVRIWAISLDTCPPTVEDHDGPVKSIAISADGLRVVSGSKDTTVKVWDTETGTCLQTLEDHRGAINFVTFSADSKRLASCSNDWTTKIWDTITGACLHTLRDDGKVCAVAFSTNDQYLASGSSGHTAKIWEAETVSRNRLRRYDD
ncbi:vegetatible incompatibility protein het-e-1 [Fusarium avenaceum]|nr:vegetatible incompatibility protein het-e-1 [Fusarium avenaceum]